MTEPAREPGEYLSRSSAPKAGGMPYVKQLSKLGNSTALIIDRPFLDQLNLAPGAEVEVSVEANSLVVRPHRYATDEEFTKAAGTVAHRRRGLMKKLADR